MSLEISATRWDVLCFSDMMFLLSVKHHFGVPAGIGTHADTCGGILVSHEDEALPCEFWA
jgi:hypothetical protein